MTESNIEIRLWTEEFGESGKVLLLIHGLGANRAIWDPLLPFIRRDWNGRVIIPDLAGHGRSPRRNKYSRGAFAADLAALVRPTDQVEIVGHSLGGALGALLGTGWFGVRVDFLLALSVKMKWSQEEIAGSHAAAEKPARLFDTLEAAQDRYLKMAGLSATSAPRSTEEGVVKVGNQYGLASDARIYGCAALGIDELLRIAKCPVMLATGDADKVGSAADMQSLGFKPTVLKGGHNIQTEVPAEIWSTFMSTRPRM